VSAAPTPDINPDVVPDIGLVAIDAPTLTEYFDASVVYSISRRATVSGNAIFYEQRLLDNEEGDARSYGAGGS
jgi:hypothetical protein